MSRRYSRVYGAFEISTLPGQCQVAVAHSFFVRQDSRGEGKAHALKQIQNVELRAGNYDFAIATVSAKNEAQKKVLTRAGWQKLTEFHNTRLAEVTEVWGYHVNGSNE